MRLSQLTAYAEEQYHITEEHDRRGFNGYSVLCDPSTGKWAALLIRQWDGERGVMLECCDIKCGREAAAERNAPYLCKPFRMQGEGWVGVRMDDDCDESVVFRLFDCALNRSRRYGATIVLASELPQPQGKSYGETALPVRAAVRVPVNRSIPPKIQEMTALYEYGDGSMRQKGKNFYIQAKFMEDYEDDQPWFGELRHYFLTYHDLRLAQLRGYFTWRTEIRKGNWQPTAVSLAYLYVYELLNGIGAPTPEDRLRKIKEFETAYPDDGTGGSGMKRNLHRWITELAVIRNVRPEVAAQYFDENEFAREKALAVLEHPGRHGDGDVYAALCAMTTVRLGQSPVTAQHGGEGTRLLAGLWRYMTEHVSSDGGNFFHMCFGTQKELRWHPLCNAVYWQEEPYADAEYRLTDNHRFLCRDGVWYEYTYPRLYFNERLLNDFCHEAERQLRIYLKTGRALKRRAAAAWMTPYISAFIEADRQAKADAAKPNITIRFSQLEQIRRDASATRDSLLTEEEMTEPEESAAAPESAPNELTSDLLDEVQLQIMRMLLNGESVRTFIRAHHLMPSVTADGINEALFDEIGDTVLACDGDELRLLEDYTKEVKELLGGSHGGE